MTRGPMGPPPYERLLAGRPEDRPEFSDITDFLAYRIMWFRKRGFFLRRRRYARAEAGARDLARMYLGRAYELGRRNPHSGPAAPGYAVVLMAGSRCEEYPELSSCVMEVITAPGMTSGQAAEEARHAPPWTMPHRIAVTPPGEFLP